MRNKQIEIAEILLDLNLDLDVIEEITSISSFEVWKYSLQKLNDKKHE